MPIAGVIVTEKVDPQGFAQTPNQRFSRLTLFGWSSATEHNEIVRVTSLSDFNTKFPSARPEAVATVAWWFASSPRGILQFVSARDDGVADTPVDADSPAPKAHYLAAIAAIKALPTLEATFLVVPELVQVTAQADRTEIYSAMEGLASERQLIHLMNGAAATDTVAEAEAEATLYSSPLGHSSFYYGFEKDASDRLIPIAAIAGSIGVQRSILESPYEPPAGAKYPIKGTSSAVSLVTAEADYESLRDRNINVVQDIARVGRCIWGARTLASDKKYRFINTRMVLSLAVRDLQEDLRPLVFESGDPQSTNRAESLRLIVGRVERIYAEGGLNGSILSDAYRLEEVEEQDNPEKSKFRLYLRPVGAIEEIEVELYNVEVLPETVFVV